MVVLQASLGVSQSESDQVWDVERDLAGLQAALAVEEELGLLRVTIKETEEGLRVLLAGDDLPGPGEEDELLLRHRADL